MTKTILVSLLAGAAMGALANVGAQERGQWYVSPNLSYIVADDDRQADDDAGLQLGLGKVIDQRWNMELSAVIDNLELENGSAEFKQRGLLLDGLYFMDRDQRVDPYLVAGIGALQTELGNNDDTHLMANVGAGVMHMLNERVSLRADLRYRMDGDDTSVASEDGFGDWVVNVGLAIPFGAAKAAPAAPAPVAEPVVLDGDGDAVNDDKDTCPDTVAGARVGADGCELDSDKDGVVDRLDRCQGTVAGARVDSAGCELDGDKDGVVNRLDRCPDTGSGIKVDARGCELDSDKDGVVDSADNCPASVAGAKVDIHGCELQEVIVLQGVNFASGSAQLTPDSSRALNEVAATLSKHPAMQVEVAGYTDNTGSRQLNVSLSRQRAQAVVDYLVAQGVAGDRLSAKGYGPANPIADNGSAEGRARNRRVELHILD